MKIFIVTWEFWDEFTIYKVFSTRKGAEHYISGYNIEVAKNLHIHEMELEQ